MLVLHRRTGESIAIGDNIFITILEIRGNKVRLGMTGPEDVHIRRLELAKEMGIVPADFVPPGLVS